MRAVAILPKTELYVGPKAVAVFCILMFCLVLAASSAVAQSKDLTEFQKETVASIREITLQLILIAMGVFAILGGFATAGERKFGSRPIIWIAFLLLGLSVVFGLLAYGNLIWTLGKGKYEPFGTLERLAMWQWITFGVGGLLFALFVLLNIRRED